MRVMPTRTRSVRHLAARKCVESRPIPATATGFPSPRRWGDRLVAANAADGDVEPLGLEAVHLGVTQLVGHVVETLAGGQLARTLERGAR
jgi:hypothetical protein